MRPINMFVFGKVTFWVKYIHSKPFVLLVFFASMLSTMGVTMSVIYLSLKLSGFIPLEENLTAFLVSFLVGATCWVIYAKLFNHECRIDP